MRRCQRMSASVSLWQRNRGLSREEPHHRAPVTSRGHHRNVNIPFSDKSIQSRPYRTTKRQRRRLLLGFGLHKHFVLCVAPNWVSLHTNHLPTARRFVINFNYTKPTNPPVRLTHFTPFPDPQSTGAEFHHRTAVQIVFQFQTTASHRSVQQQHKSSRLRCFQRSQVADNSVSI